MKTIPNLLLFCGSGRNIGKTALLCSIIKHCKKEYKIAAIKISPNFHAINQSGIIVEKEEGFTIFREKEISDKDTSLFLQAGATVSYYIETDDKHIEAAFNIIYQIVAKDMLIVCESGKLANYIKPGLMAFVYSSEEKPETNKKETNKQPADLIIDVSEGKLEYWIKQVNHKIMVENGQWILK